MATEEIPLEGRTLSGRYLLEEQIASGGMGALWRGGDRVLGRTVAVKVLHDRLARDPELLERFRLEAVAAARLSHPNVVRVFDTGVDDGVCFIVMELVDGHTMRDALEGGPLEPREASALVRSVLLGLAHAHREGVVHRDVKPANVLIDRSGLVKVTDFGIAKAAFAPTDLTTTGNLLGTARYLAPEQVQGAAVDGRTDVYACGILLYEALTGRVPFEGKTHIATATRRLTEDAVRPRALRSGIPRAVDDAVMHALARDPGDRFQSAEEMASALDRVAAPPEPLPLPEPAAPGPAPRRNVRRWLMPLVALLLFGGAIAGGYLLFERLPIAGPGGGNGGREDVERLDVQDATSYDPLGDGSEHEDTADLAVDGEAGTAWTTEGYTTADLGGAKDGVGLIVELGEPASVGEVRITSELQGWRFRLYAGDSAGGLEGTEPLVAGGEDTFRAEQELALELVPAEATYLLIWVTEVVPADDGYRALVNEVAVLGSGG